MRPFNQRESKIIDWLARNQREAPLSLRESLEALFFTRASGRCLILQPGKKYAMFFFDLDNFKDEEAKGTAISELIEIMLLFNYLNQNHYITIFRGEHCSREKMFFFSEAFDNPHLDKDKVVLNADGLHSTRPEAIKNGDEEVVYKGVEQKNGNFDLLYQNTVGDFCISERINELLPSVDEAKAESSEEVATESSRREERGWRIMAASLAAVCFMLALTLLMPERLKEEIRSVIMEESKADTPKTTLNRQPESSTPGTLNISSQLAWCSLCRDGTGRLPFLFRSGRSDKASKAFH